MTIPQIYYRMEMTDDEKTLLEAYDSSIKGGRLYLGRLWRRENLGGTREARGQACEDHANA